MRVLVTGATGFVGRRLTSLLQGEGHEVVALIRRADDEVAGQRIVVERLDSRSVRDALSNTRIDAVVNLAAAGVHPADRDPATLAQVNAIFPADLVSIAHICGARAFVQIGSSAEYAGLKAAELLDEHTPLESFKIYGASKAAGSLLASAWGANIGLPVAVLRLFNVFGPGEASHRLLPSLVSKLSIGEKVSLSAGTQVRDFMHVDDACRGIVIVLEALIRNPSLRGIYNYATGCATSVADFSRMIARALSADSGLLGFGELPFRPDDLPYVVGNPDTFKKTFADAAFHPLEKAVAMAVDELLKRDSH